MGLKDSFEEKIEKNGVKVLKNEADTITVGTTAVDVVGFLTDSVITNVVNNNPNCAAVSVVRENGLNNVMVSNTVVAKKKL